MVLQIKFRYTQFGALGHWKSLVVSRAKGRRWHWSGFTKFAELWWTMAIVRLTRCSKTFGLTWDYRERNALTAVIWPNALRSRICLWHVFRSPPSCESEQWWRDCTISLGAARHSGTIRPLTHKAPTYRFVTTDASVLRSLLFRHAPIGVGLSAEVACVAWSVS